MQADPGGFSEGWIAFGALLSRARRKSDRLKKTRRTAKPLMSYRHPYDDEDTIVQ